MHFKQILCLVLFLTTFCFLSESRSYNNGLIFYNLENHQTYLPPTVSVSRGRGLANFKYSARGSIWSTFGRPCDCDGPLCGCCVGIKVKQYNFDQKMCANVSYVPRKDEVQLEVFLNDTANAKYGISARDPSPLCIPIMMGIPMSMCIKMSNVGLQGDNLNMCMDFLVRLASTELFEMHFQCMKVGLQGASWVGADGQPVIPPSQGKITDKSDNESQEYYDESEEENEILSKEEQKKKDELSSMNLEEEDVNKAEEEMDYNDIADKVMDIVKEQEQEEEEELTDEEELLKEKEMQETENNKMSTGDMEKIVTNIMESIKESHDKDENEMITETAIELGTEASDMVTMMESADMSSDIREEEEKPVLMEVGQNLENEEKLDVTEAMENIESEFVVENEEKPFGVETMDVMESSTLEQEEKPAFMEAMKTMESSTLKQGETDEKETLLNSPEMLEKEEFNLGEKKEESEPMKDETVNMIETNEVIEEHTITQDIVPNSQKKEELLETNQDEEKGVKEPLQDTNETLDSTTIKFQEEFYETTTQHLLNDQESNEIHKFEMLINNNAEATTETQQIDNSLEMLQQSMETSTEHVMAANLKPTMPQIAATTSETNKIDSVDNTLTTATIMTTTKQPTITNENTVVAVTFIENANDHEKTINTNKADNDDAQNKDKENVTGDNTHENDSDYDDEDGEDDDDEEESEEIEDETAEDETTEHEMLTNDAITTIKIITTANDLNKETSTTERLTIAADATGDTKTETETTNKTNESSENELPTKEQEEKENETVTSDDEEEEDDDEDEEDEVEEETETHTEKQNDSEDEYYDEYEDYESTTLAITDLTTKDTCCQSSTPSLVNDPPFITTTTATTLIEHLNGNTNDETQLQTNATSSSNNLKFLSNTNSKISTTDSDDMLNMESTTSKMSQITLKPAVTSATTTTSSSSSSNILPLPLARQLFALQRQQQQRRQQLQQKQQQQYQRFSRQRQFYV